MLHSKNQQSIAHQSHWFLISSIHPQHQLIFMWDKGTTSKKLEGTGFKGNINKNKNIYQ